MSTLFLITARAGSRGVPGKNLKKIGGLSLIGWKACAAHVIMREYCHDARMIISTDDDDMACEAKRHGVEVPFQRPKELATDDASSADVITHAMEWIKSNWNRTYTDIMLLEPSSPFAQPEHFHEALVMSAKHDAHLVAGMRRVEPNSVFVGTQRPDKFITPIIVQMQRAGHHLRRQDLQPEWTMNGALYLFAWDTFERTHDVYGGSRNYGLLMDKWHSVEIDSPDDLEIASYAYEAGHINKPPEYSPWKNTMVRNAKRWPSPPPITLEKVE